MVQDMLPGSVTGRQWKLHQLREAAVAKQRLHDGSHALFRRRISASGAELGDGTEAV